MTDISFWYVNHRGERALRRARPVSIRYGTSEYYEVNGWLMLAHDLDRDAEREFCMARMHFIDFFHVTVLEFK